jgi:hypothetical protein
MDSGPGDVCSFHGFLFPKVVQRQVTGNFACSIQGTMPLLVHDPG